MELRAPPKRGSTVKTIRQRNESTLSRILLKLLDVDQPKMPQLATTATGTYEGCQTVAGTRNQTLRKAAVAPIKE